MSYLAKLFGSGAQAALAGDPLDDRYYETAAGVRALTGDFITPTRSLSVAAFFRGVSILANTFAGLPLQMFEKTPDGSREVADHPVEYALSEAPNARQTSFEWRRLVLATLVMQGNAFNQLVWDDQRRLSLIPLDPAKVRGPEVLSSGRWRYWFVRDGGDPVPLLSGVDIWHLQGLSLDGKRGLSLIEIAKNTIGVANAAEDFAALFFDRGVTFKGVLLHKGNLKPETAAAMSVNFQQAYGGKAGAHRTPVLWEGMTYEPLSMSNKDAEFMDSRRFSISEIARLLGLPPHMLGDVERSTSWGTGIEEQRSDMTTFTMLPWAKLFEEGAKKNLIEAIAGGRSPLYIRLNLNALLRAKTKERYDVYGIGIERGILSPNDCRRLEELPPRPGGDVYKNINARPSTPPPPAEAEPKKEGPDAGGRLLALGEELRQIRGTVGELHADVLRSSATEYRARAEAFAGYLAGEILGREVEAMLAEAARHAGNPDRWRHAVGSFFGRHAAHVEAALGVSKDAARAYCRDRQLALMDRGASALETWVEDNRAEVVRLALGPEAAVAAEQRATVNVTVNNAPAVTQIENKVAAAPAPAVTVNAPVTVRVPDAPAPVVNVAAPAATPRIGPVEVRLVGEVAARVKEMPPPRETVTEVIERDKVGRPKKVIHTPKG